jgi:hypothetical protein
VQVTRGRHGAGRVRPDLESCHGQLSIRSRRLPESVALLPVPSRFCHSCPCRLVGNRVHCRHESGAQVGVLSDTLPT